MNPSANLANPSVCFAVPCGAFAATSHPQHTPPLRPSKSLSRWTFPCAARFLLSYAQHRLAPVLRARVETPANFGTSPRGSLASRSAGVQWVAMEPENPTLEVLKQIREEGKKTNERINETNERLSETNERVTETNVHLDQMRDELSRRIVESEMRTATAITALAGTVGDLVTFLKQNRDLASSSASRRSECRTEPFPS